MESGRQLFHVVLAFIILFVALTYGKELALYLLFLGLLFGFFARFVRKPKKIIDFLTDLYARGGRGLAPFLYVIGLIILYYFFSLRIAILTTVAFSIGDSVSNIAGGGTNLPYSRKTWRGTLSGFFASFVILLGLASFGIALATAFVSSFIESFNWRDDNIPIIIGTAIFLYVLNTAIPLI